MRVLSPCDAQDVCRLASELARGRMLIVDIVATVSRHTGLDAEQVKTIMRRRQSEWLATVEADRDLSGLLSCECNARKREAEQEQS